MVNDKEILKKVLKILENTTNELLLVVNEINDLSDNSNDAYKVSIKGPKNEPN